MSETRSFTIPSETVKKLKYLSGKFKSLNTGNKSRNFWMVVEENSESYEWDSLDVGINDSGELITCSQSGCSCNSHEYPADDVTNTFSLSGAITVPYDSYYSAQFSELDNLIEMTDTLYDIFKTKKYEAEKVLAIPNAEIRRAVIEYLGIASFLKKANPMTLDESEYGKLVKIEVSEDEDIVAVYVKDASTNRKYFLRVPPKTKTAKEAVAWTFGFKESDYNPEVQT